MVENVNGKNEKTESFEDTIRSAWQDQWWSMLLGSILTTVFGLLVFFMPGLSIATFVLMFGAFAIAAGILQLWQTVTIKDGKWVLKHTNTRLQGQKALQLRSNAF